MRGWAFSAGLALLIAGVGVAATAPAPVYLPLAALPTSLDPATLKIANDSYIFRQLAEGLFTIGEAFQIVPRLADSIEWSADQRTLKVRLREAKFSDGSSVTAKDAADSILYCVRNAEKTLLVAVRAIDGYEPFMRGHARELSGLKVTGPSTLEIHLSRQAPLLLDDLAQADCHIVKPAPDGSRDLLKGATGSGPYILDSVGSTDLVLRKNAYYYARISGPETAVFRLTDDYGKFDSLKSWATMTTTEEKPSPDPAFRSIEISELGTYQLILNNAKHPFDKVSVRQAVARALDYELLAKDLGWSLDTLQAGLVPLGMRGFTHRDPGSRAADLAEANRLLRRAGYTPRHPLKFTILISKLPDYEREAPIWPELFAGAPIEARVEMVAHAERHARIARGDFQAVRGIKYAGSIESHRLLSSYLTGSTYNPTRSHEAACDRLISRSISTVDREERFHLYAEADSCLTQRAILIPLASIQSEYVLLKKPWRLSRTNRYLLYPYWISEWRNDGS